jgi:molecular chaperone GrpE
MVDKAAKAKEAETVDELNEVTPDKQELEGELEIIEEVPDLDEQLTKMQAQAAEYLDGWQRSRAELANYKRRTEAQRTEMILSANSNLLTKLLPVLDDLQLALDNSPQEDSGSWDEWRDGVALVAHKFAVVLEEVGIVPIETEGEFFDPNVHEAISHEANPDFESGQVIAQVRQGYKLGSRVLRAAMVRVAQ